MLVCTVSPVVQSAGSQAIIEFSSNQRGRKSLEESVTHANLGQLMKSMGRKLIMGLDGIHFMADV